MVQLVETTQKHDKSELGLSLTHLKARQLWNTEYALYGKSTNALIYLYIPIYSLTVA